MPTGDNGENPGDDDTANKKVGNANAGDKDADKSDKSDKGDDAGEAEKTPKAITFSSQKDLDDFVSRRVNRATKDRDDRAKLSKEQQLEKDLDEARAQVRDRDLKDEFVEATGIDSGRAGRLFRMYRDDIETDDKGHATNIKDVLITAKRDFPELFGKVRVAGKADGGEGNGGNGKAVGGDMNAALRKMAGRN